MADICRVCGAVLKGKIVARRGDLFCSAYCAVDEVEAGLNGEFQDALNECEEVMTDDIGVNLDV